MVPEFLAVVARAAVQWVLASLLLANGTAFCLIAAVSERLRLGPPCILCARVHRLLSSAAAAGEGPDALRLLLCDAHLTAVADTGSESEARGDPGNSGNGSRGGMDVDDRNKGSGNSLGLLFYSSTADYSLKKHSCKYSVKKIDYCK